MHITSIPQFNMTKYAVFSKSNNVENLTQRFGTKIFQNVVNIVKIKNEIHTIRYIHFRHILFRYFSWKVTYTYVFKVFFISLYICYCNWRWTKCILQNKVFKSLVLSVALDVPHLEWHTIGLKMKTYSEYWAS